MRKVAVLGSTGSIGTQALRIISDSGTLELHSILCAGSTGLLREQMGMYRPELACAVSPSPGMDTAGMITGPECLQQAVAGADIVLNAIVGSAGLRASLLCQELGLPLALANKESLVIGGELLGEHLSRGRVVPVDSEHSTIHRCIRGEDRPVLGVTLTASGGSARGMTPEALNSAGPSEILAHPTWSMGRRITVDSATMVNKAFEVIEAMWLFGVPVEAVIHPQSIVHSLVRLADGAWKALLGRPDMKVPIQYALLERGEPMALLEDDDPLDWGTLEFEPLDPAVYPAFGLVVSAGEEGGTLPAAANAADEVAVEAFLSGRISFGDIPRIIEGVLERHQIREVNVFEDVTTADAEARRIATEMVDRLC